LGRKSAAPSIFGEGPSYKVLKSLIAERYLQHMIHINIKEDAFEKLLIPCSRGRINKFRHTLVVSIMVYTISPLGVTICIPGLEGIHGSV
jgi:hypothetical protein